ITASLLAGEPPDPRLGAMSKQRSVHNNYLTLPVLLMMVSNHYPMLTGHPHPWLIVALILVIGGSARHFLNRHDRADEGADMDERAAAGKDAAEEGRGDHDQDEEQDRQQERVAAERRLAEPVVDEPAGDQAEDRDDHRLVGQERHHRLVDEKGAGVPVILDAEQPEAGDPGEVGLPLEPDEVGRQGGRRDQVFLHVVEAAAVDLPGGAIDAFGHGLALAQPEVEGDEIKRGADPADAHHEMGPADQEVQPVGDEGGHCSGRFPVSRRSVRGAAPFAPHRGHGTSFIRATEVPGRQRTTSCCAPARNDVP
ncbi:MAG: urate hydroxylase PuuD, partial [Rhizobiales bacterium]|nr:urate hydroxylase PuuD [Hyphomicrobiales bacterium]